MAVQGGQVVWDLDIDNTKFNSKLKAASSDMQKTTSDAAGKAGSSWLKTGATLGVVAGVAQSVFTKAMSIVSSSVDGAVRRVDTLNNFPKVMSNLGYQADESAAAIKALDLGVRGLPTSIDGIALAMQRIAPSTKNLSEATDLALAMNNAILAGGAPVAAQQSAMEQFSQAILRGKFDMMEWRTVGTTMPGQLSQIARAFGIAGGDTTVLYTKMKEGTITMDQFKTKMMELNKTGVAGFQSFAQQAKNSTGGINTGIANMNTAITRGITKIMTAIGTENISKAISNFGKYFEKGLTLVANAIKSVITLLQPLFNIISNNASLVRDIGLGLLAAGAAFLVVQGAIWLVHAAAGALVTVFTALTSPIGLVVLSIAALVAVAVLIERKFGIISETAKSLWNIIQLLVTGDFKGGIFGLAEDSPFIDTLFKIRDVGLLVVNFIKGEFSKIMESTKIIFQELAKSMQPLIDAFKEFWSKHGDKVMTVLKVIGGVIAAIAIAPLVIAFGLFLAALKVVSVVLGFVARHFETIKKVIKVVLVAAFLPLILVIGAVVGAVKLSLKIFSKLSGWFKSGGKAIGKTLDKISDGFQTMLDVIKTVMKAIFNVIKPPLDFIKNIFIIVFGSILIVVLTVLQVIKNVITWAFNTYVTIVRTVLTTILNFVRTVWNSIYNTISGIVGKIINFFAPAWNWLYEKGKAVVQGLVDGIRAMANAVWEAIKAVSSKIGSFFSGAWNWLYNTGKTIVEGLSRGIRAMANGVWSAIKAAADKIGAFFGGAWNWLYGVGVAIVQGLINGMRDMIYWVGRVAGDVGNTVKNKLKSVLGIRSPSKVMYEFGDNIGQGLINGIDSKIGKIKDISGEMALNVQSPMVDTNSFGTNVNNSESVTNINGNIILGDKTAVDEFFAKLNRNNELAQKGMATL